MTGLVDYGRPGRPGRLGRPSKFQGFNMFQPNQTFSDIDHDHLSVTNGSAKSPLVALQCLPMGRQGQSPEMLGLPHFAWPKRKEQEGAAQVG